MAGIPVGWRRAAARLVRFRLLHYLMRWGIRGAVSRHRVGVVLVALDEWGRVLMLRHVFHPYTPWGLPGGWLHRHESPADAVLREVKEEIGVTAILDSVIQIESQSHPPHIGIAYLGQIQPGPMTLSAEIIEADWFPPDDLPAPLSPFIKQAIETAVSQHRKGNYLPT